MIKKGNSFLEKMENPTAHARIQGPCGDAMEFSLAIVQNKIRQVRCLTSGCGASKACAIETARMAQGKSISGALLISPGKVIQRLKHVPVDHLHCAILSVSTLHRAIGHYLMSGKKKINLRGKGHSHE